MNIQQLKKNLDKKSNDQLIEMTSEILEEFHEEIMELRDDDKYKESLSLINKVLSFLRRDALGSDYDYWLTDILYHKCEVLYALGKTGEALKICMKILKIDPKDSETLYMKGWILSDLDRHKEALQSYRKSLQYEPEDKDTLINISHEFLKLHKYDEALKFAKRAIRMDKKDDYAWYNMGEAFLGKGQYRKALQVFERSLKLDPKEDDVWYMKARCLSKSVKKNYEKAIDSLLVAISLNRENKIKARKERDFLPLKSSERFKKLLT